MTACHLHPDSRVGKLHWSQLGFGHPSLNSYHHHPPHFFFFFQGLGTLAESVPLRVPVLSRLWGRTQGFCPPPSVVVMNFVGNHPQMPPSPQALLVNQPPKVSSTTTPSPTGQHTRGLWGSNTNRAKHPPRPPSTMGTHDHPQLASITAGLMGQFKPGAQHLR
jgi:hypothetical protein